MAEDHQRRSFAPGELDQLARTRADARQVHSALLDLLVERDYAVIEPHFQRLLGDLLRAELSTRVLTGTTPVVPLDAVVPYNARCLPPGR